MGSLKEHNLSNVIIEVDCLNMVLAINSSIPYLFNVGVVLNDCKFILSELVHCSLIHVKRLANHAAHVLAKASVYMFDKE